MGVVGVGPTTDEGSRSGAAGDEAFRGKGKRPTGVRYVSLKGSIERLGD